MKEPKQEPKDYFEITDLVKFAEALGVPRSIGLDPFPPGQYLHFKSAKDQKQAVLAWARSKVFRHGHRQPYCTTPEALDPKTGKRVPRRALKLKDAVKELKMTWPDVSAAWKGLEADGLVRRDEFERLIVVGDPPPAQEESDEDRRKKREPDYIKKYFTGLSPEQHELERQSYEEVTKGVRDLHAAVMAVVRDVTDPIMDIWWRKRGITVPRDTPASSQSGVNGNGNKRPKPVVHLTVAPDAIPQDLLPMVLLNLPVQARVTIGSIGSIQVSDRDLYRNVEKRSEIAATPQPITSSGNGHGRASSENYTEKDSRASSCGNFISKGEVGRSVGSETNPPTSAHKNTTPNPTQNVEMLLRKHGLKTTGKTPQLIEVHRVVEALGYATLEQFETRVKNRIEAGLKITDYGIFIHLARDCAKSAADWDATPTPKPPQKQSMAESYISRRIGK